MTNLSLTIAGRTSDEALRENMTAATKAEPFGHAWHSFRPANEKVSGFGFSISPLADALPTSVAIDGVAIALTPGLTPSEFTDRKTGVVTTKVPRRKVTATGTATFPSLGETKAYEVNISETSNGQWNLKISVHRERSSASPEDRAAARALAQASRAQSNSAKFGF